MQMAETAVPDLFYQKKEYQMSTVDEKLLLKIGQGDADALEALYAAASGAVFAYAYSILRDRQDAEDALQDTFLKIHAAAHLYEPQGRPMAWILTITRNICMMQFRGRQRITVLEHEDQTADWGRIPDTEDRQVLKAAFSILTEEESRIILLHAVAGLKHKETAALLDMHLSTVLSKYHRGIRKLRQELERSEQ